MSEQDAESHKRMFPGRVIVWPLAGVVLLAGGIYLLNSWDRMAAGGRAGAIVLIVLGSLLVLPLLLVAGIYVAVRIFVGKLKRDLTKATSDLKGAASGLLGSTNALYAKVHEFRDADDDDFDGLDRGYYDGVVHELTHKGYRHLGDLVDATIAEVQGVTVPIRVFTSADGCTQAAAYHVVMPGGAASDEPKLMRDVSTEFTDGTFLLTSNSQGLDMMTPPPEMVRQQYPLATPLEQMLVEHETRKAQLIAEKAPAGARCVAVHTLAEAIESEKRQQQAKNTFRQKIGFIDPDEVRAVAERSGGEDAKAAGEFVANAVDQARREYRRENPSQ